MQSGLPRLKTMGKAPHPGGRIVGGGAPLGLLFLLACGSSGADAADAAVGPDASTCETSSCTSSPDASVDALADAPTDRSADTSADVSADASSPQGGTPCLPFTMPPAATLFGSSKKVFAHYFYPFPLSIDNKPAAQDYYNTQYLSPTGESNKWISQGGYLRSRPLPVPVGSSGSPSQDGEPKRARPRRSVR